MGFRIEFSEGSAVQTLDVSARRTTVGSDDACAVRLRAEGVEGLHAIFRHDHGSWLVEPVGRARVSVDERPISSAVLRPGRIVAIGAARLRVVAVSAHVDEILPEPETADGAAEDAAGRPYEREPDTADTFAPHDGPAPAPNQPPRPPRAVRTYPQLIVLPPATPKHRSGRWFAASLLAHVVVLGSMQLYAYFHPRAREVKVELGAALAFDLMPELPPELDELPVQGNPFDDLTDPPPDVPIDPVVPEQDPFRAPPDEMPPPISLTPPPPPRNVRLSPALSRPAVGTAPVVGIGPSASVLSGASFGKDGADAANRRAAELLTGDGGGNGALSAVKGRATSATVWVIRGDYDQAEKTLDVLGVKHAIVTKEILEQMPIGDDVRVLIYNCTGKPMEGSAQARVARWVAAGGHLLTTDWGVERLLEKGLPGTLVPLRHGGRQIMTPDETVEVRVAANATSAPARTLLAGVPAGDESCRWWLEDTSLPFEAAAPGGSSGSVAVGAVDTLVASSDLDRRHGSPMVAATFSYGQGRVLHLLGHIHQKEGNLRGTYLVQRILVNFLADALRN